MTRKRVAVLISGVGGNLQALIDAAKAEDYPAEIVLVISNNPDAYGLTRAKEAGIENILINHKEYESRDAFDAAIDAQLRKHHIDIICLAGFMRLLTEGFVIKWQGRLLNVHPSLLPDFKGAYAVRDALEAGGAKTGCTIHIVTPQMDEGPVLMQAEVPILEGDTEETLHERIHTREHTLYPAALKQLAENVTQN